MTKNQNNSSYIEHENLSIAWGRALESALANSRERAPLVVSITGFDAGVPREDPSIRAALDKFVLERDGWSIETVANTIFPLHQWNPQQPASVLYDRYLRTYPKLRKMPDTRRGTYFGRMVARDSAPTNQLDLVLNSYRAGTRRSKLQISIFEPETDHINSPYQAFPCMQHVANVHGYTRLVNDWPRLVDVEFEDSAAHVSIVVEWVPVAKQIVRGRDPSHLTTFPDVERGGFGEVQMQLIERLGQSRRLRVCNEITASLAQADDTTKNSNIHVATDEDSADRDVTGEPMTGGDQDALELHDQTRHVLALDEDRC